MPTRRAKHEIRFILAAFVHVRVFTTIPAKHDAALRAFNFGILVHSEGGMFAAAFVKFWHFIVLLSFSAFPFSWPPLPHPHLAGDASDF